jgi:hypothetical protein
MARARSALTLAVVAAGSLSFAMEWTQMYLPSRVASVIDLVSNTAGGALGALPALLLLRRPDWHRWLIAQRERWFMRGRAGDFGLALLAIWLLVQVNPAIPLFAATFNFTARLAADAAATALEAAQTLFNVVGVGLFVGLLLRERRHIGGTVLVFVGATVMLKGVAAGLLLKRSVWEHWLGTGPMVGLLLGCALLFGFVRLSHRAQSVLCSVALLSGLGTTLLAPELLLLGAPLSQFSWSYGQLLNFNGLTHATLLVWPIVVSVFLFALAGRQTAPQDPKPPTEARV